MHRKQWHDSRSSASVRGRFSGQCTSSLFNEMGLFAGESYPNAERIARRGFYLPSGLALTDEQMERVATAMRQVFA
jgi:Predicted pyridoxal phosphate-dependent enzyme apparently involved in regulation of cell wall biogenesis